MTKELEKEYLEDLDHYDEGMGIHSTSYEKCKERLIRLAKIDNSNPSEALECLHKIARKVELADYDDYWEVRNAHSKVEQALIKAQEQEKVLKIIKNKGVDIGYLNTCETLEEYNSNCWNDEEDFNKSLTEEEFDLVKRYCDDKN